MQVQNETKPYDTINVTPMLDLAYVLLVVFIIMTTASVQGMTMSLPKPSNKPSTDKKHEIKIVQITPEGNVVLNGAATAAPTAKEGRLPCTRLRTRPWIPAFWS